MPHSIEKMRFLQLAIDRARQLRYQLRVGLLHFRRDLEREVSELRRAFRHSNVQRAQQLRRRLQSPGETSAAVTAKPDSTQGQTSAVAANAGNRAKAAETAADKAKGTKKATRNNTLKVDREKPGGGVREAAATAADIWRPMVRQGVESLLNQAVNTELKAFIASHRDYHTEDGRRAIVRNGYLPKRIVKTDLGPLRVRIPKTRDRLGQGIKFNSQLLPPYSKRTHSKMSSLDWLYWHGMATGDFYPLLLDLLGIGDVDSSPAFPAALKDKLESQWQRDHAKRQKYDWSNTRAVDLRATDICKDSAANTESCYLIVAAIDDQNQNKLLTVTAGNPDDPSKWTSLLIDLYERGLRIPASVAWSEAAGPDLFRETVRRVFW